MTEKYLTANGVKLCYDEFGDPANPAMILIMGLGTQMIAWPETFCRQLAAQGFRVIRYDNRDIGLSEKMHSARTNSIPMAVLKSKLRLPIRVAYRLSDMANDCVGLMDALNIDQAHVVGVSMGGMIGQLVTANDGHRVKSFTSIMSTSSGPKAPAARRHITAAMLRKAAPTQEAMIQQRVELLRLIGSIGTLAPRQDELLAKVVASQQRSYYPAGYMRHMLAILDNGSRVDLLKTIDRPTLVLHGKADPLVPVEAGIDTARHIANARLELFDEMGHDLPASLLPRFVELICSHADSANGS